MVVVVPVSVAALVVVVVPVSVAALVVVVVPGLSGRAGGVVVPDSVAALVVVSRSWSLLGAVSVVEVVNAAWSLGC